MDKPAYEAASAEVMATLHSLEVVVEELGWDEAYLGAQTEDPEELAESVRAQVRQRTGLECSVGIGQNRLQAKIATGYAKPAGVFRVTYDSWFDLLGDQPVTALWGVGGRTAKRLAPLGVHTVRELATMDDAVLAAEFGPTIGPWLGRLARSDDRTPVSGTPAPRRSRGHEVTFQENLLDWSDVRREVERMVDLVAAEVPGDGKLVDRVVVKVRYAPFFTATRSQAVRPPTQDRKALLEAALEALARFEPDRPVRLVGVAAQFAR